MIRNGRFWSVGGFQDGPLKNPLGSLESSTVDDGGFFGHTMAHLTFQSCNSFYPAGRMARKVSDLVNRKG